MLHINKWCTCTDVANVSGKFLHVGFSFFAHNNCKKSFILHKQSGVDYIEVQSRI